MMYYEIETWLLSFLYVFEIMLCDCLPLQIFMKTKYACF